MENVRILTSQIKDGLVQKSASKKDEISVMKAMLNDPNYIVGIYDKSGKIGDYCPYADCRKMFSSVISSTTKIPTKEADQLAEKYEVTKNDATTMINISKEFINTYLQTGRKMPLGGRKSTNTSLILRHVDEKKKTIPSKNSDKIHVVIPAHDSVKSESPCPVWLK